MNECRVTYLGRQIDCAFSYKSNQQLFHSGPLIKPTCCCSTSGVIFIKENVKAQAVLNIKKKKCVMLGLLGVSVVAEHVFCLFE